MGSKKTSNLFVFVLLSFYFINLFSSRSFAFPQYSVKEKMDCVACHYSAQGGPTNGRGRYYAEHLTLEGYVEKLKKKKIKKVRAKPAPVPASADSDD